MGGTAKHGTSLRGKRYEKNRSYIDCRRSVPVPDVPCRRQFKYRRFVSRHFRLGLVPADSGAFGISQTLRHASTPTAESATEPSDPPDDVDLTAFGETLLDRYSFGATTVNNDTGEVRTSLMVLDPNNEEDRQVIDNFYEGLTDLPLRQCLVCINNFTTVEAELALVQTESPEDVTAVEEIFQARTDYMVGDGSGPSGAWYPRPTEVWKNNSRIVSNGTYIMFVVHPTEYDEIADDFNALFGS